MACIGPVYSGRKWGRDEVRVISSSVSPWYPFHRRVFTEYKMHQKVSWDQRVTPGGSATPVARTKKLFPAQSLGMADFTPLYGNMDCISPQAVHTLAGAGKILESQELSASRPACFWVKGWASSHGRCESIDLLAYPGLPTGTAEPLSPPQHCAALKT